LQVARLLLRGIEQGKYHLPSADLGQNLLVSGMTSLRRVCAVQRRAAGCVGSNVGGRSGLEDCPMEGCSAGPAPHISQGLCVSGLCEHEHIRLFSCSCLVLMSGAADRTFPPSCSPKRFPLLVHVLLGPILPIATSVFGWIANSTATKYNKTHGMPQRPQADS
jgi:hypothetical protein